MGIGQTRTNRTNRTNSTNGANTAANTANLCLFYLPLFILFVCSVCAVSTHLKANSNTRKKSWCLPFHLVFPLAIYFCLPRGGRRLGGFQNSPSANHSTLLKPFLGNESTLDCLAECRNCVLTLVYMCSYLPAIHCADSCLRLAYKTCIRIRIFLLRFVRVSMSTLYLV